MNKENKENREVSNSKKPKYNYLETGKNNELHKVYISPQKRDKSVVMKSRNSIQEFSPYRNNHEEIKTKNHIIQDVVHQNQVLTQQLNEYRTITSRLQTELRQRTQAYQVLSQTISTDQRYYQTVIHEMKTQIQALLSKNLMLENDIKRLSEVRNKERLTDSLWKDQLTFREQISDLIFNAEKDKKRKNSEIKSNLQGILRRQSTLEEFAKSIMQMHRRIQGQDDSDLKSLWKWLKMLGQEHNYFNKIKRQLANHLNISSDQPFPSIMEHLFREINIIS